MALKPVDFDPFADSSVSTGTLTPVDHDPFAGESAPTAAAVVAPTPAPTTQVMSDKRKALLDKYKSPQQKAKPATM